MPLTAVTIVIVNFNAGTRLRDCLASLDAGLPATSWDAIVVDNASTDGSVDALPVDPRIRLVRNATNRGFGSAVNQAARLSEAPLLWLLNPDCRLLPDCFAPLARALAAHRDCAIAAPQLLNEDGTVQASARGEPDALTGLFGRHGALTKLFPRASPARRNLPAQDLVAANVDSAPVDWVMGASMLIRKALFDEVGGFDERYFLYWEDADLCRRLRDRGYHVRYLPGARVIHAGGVSAGAASALATREFHRSAYRYYATHVVRSPWHPARWFARAALTARAQWRIARGR